MKLNKLSQGLLAAACLAAGNAQANTITFDLSNIASQSSNLSNVLMSFQEFNPLWGTLTGVEVDMFSKVDSTVTLTNKNPTSQHPAVTLPVSLKLDMPVGAALNSASGQSLLTGDLNVGAKVGSVFGTASESGSLVLSASQTYSGASLAAFTGAGTLNSYLTVNAKSAFAGNKIVAQYVTSANGYGHVTYTFTALPVPEPETYAMLLAGLGLVGFAAKRSKRAA